MSTPEDKTPDEVEETPAAEVVAPDAEEVAGLPGASGDAGEAELTEDVEGDGADEAPSAPVDEAPADEPATDDAPAEEPVAVATPTRPVERAPAPTRRARRPVGERPVVRAQAKYVRTSARKARLVCDHIRGKSVEEARAILAHAPRAVAEDWQKLLESAVANAEHNHELVGEDLEIKAIFADEGPTLKRFRPRAMGRATRIRKRTSHLTIQLTPKD